MNEQRLVWKLESLKLLSRIPDPLILTWYDDYFTKCPNFYNDYNELASEVIDLLGKVEPQLLLQDLSLQTDEQGRADILHDFLQKILPANTDEFNRCSFLSDTAYFDSRRGSDVALLGEMDDPIILPWLESVIRECPTLKVSNPELSTALEKTVMSFQTTIP